MIRYRVVCIKGDGKRTLILTDYLDAARVSKDAFEKAHPEYQYEIVDLRPGNEFFDTATTEASDGNNH